MSPSKIVRRTGIVTSVASGAFAIALAATPAQAAGSLIPGMPCPLTLDPSTGLQCVNGVLQSVTSQLPLPTPAPTSSAPSTTTSSSPNPLGGLTSSVGGAVGNLGGTVGNLGNTVGGVTGSLGQTLNNTTSSVGGAVNQTVGGMTGGSLPGVPTPSTPGGVTPGGSGSPTGTSGGGTSTGTSSTGSKKAGSGKGTTTNGSSLLGPAAAFLPGAGIAGFSDLGSSGSELAPLADNIPSPLIAAPEARLAAVQAPLIAAGEKAGNDSGSFLARFANGKALPGLLVVLATAAVAAVGAGNIRAWQAKLAAGGLKLPSGLKLPAGFKVPEALRVAATNLRMPKRGHGDAR